MAIPCPDDAAIYVGSKRPSEGSLLNHRGENPIYSGREAAADRAQEAANQDAWVGTLADAISGDQPAGTPVVAAERSALTAEGNRQTKLIDAAEAADNVRQHDFQDGVNRYSGATVGDASLYLNITNAVSRLFADKGAQLNKFFVTNFGSVGRSILDNKLVSAFQAMKPDIQGHLARYHEFNTELLRMAEPIARREGWDTRDLLLAAGDYANGQHVAERNALILVRWKDKLAAERVKEKPDQKRITELETWIDDLERNLEELVPIDAEGNPLQSLRSAGYTNAEARQLMQDVIKRTGASEAEIQSLADGIRKFQQRILQDRVERGLVPAEQLAEFPDFEHYVPFRTFFDNTTGIINDTNVYHPSKYSAIDGMAAKPDSAYYTITQYAKRSAIDMGQQRLGTELAAARHAAALANRDVGLDMFSYREVMNAYSGKQGDRRRRWAEGINNQGGLVTKVPKYDAEGNYVGSADMILTFKQNWTDPHTGLTGAQLNAALTDSVKAVSGFAPLIKLNSRYGQMFTRWNPAFAPVNGLMRDPIERAVHMASRDWYDDNGMRIRGSSLVGSYFLNMPRAGKYFYDYVAGKLDPASKGAAYVREYIDHGLHQQYTWGQKETHRSLADVVASIEQGGKQRSWMDNAKMSGLKKQLKELGSMGESAAGIFDKWNDYFNNINIFNQYMTMREAGMSAERAAQGTLEMLNLYQTGTIQPLLATLFPFTKPTIQTAVATARSLGLAPNAQGKFQPNVKGAMNVMGMTAALSVVLPLLKEGLGIDEESGMYRIDQLHLSMLGSMLPIAINDDGDYAKLHIGFGLPQLAMVAAAGFDRVQRGLMEPGDFVFELLYTLGKNVSPGDFPAFSARMQPAEWLSYMFTPSALKPLFAQTDFMGRPITTARAGEMTPKAEQGRMGTERVYHQIAKWIQSGTGIDMAPEQVRNWIRHWAVGPARVVRAVLEGGELPIVGALNEEGGLRVGGERKTAVQEMGTFWEAMGGSLVYGRTSDTGRAMYYQALNYYKERVRRDGIDITSREYGSDVAKREAYQRRGLEAAGWSSEDIADFLLLQRTESDIRSVRSRFNQDIKPIFLSSEDSEPIRGEFEKLASQTGAMYNRAVQSLNYYTGAR